MENHIIPQNNTQLTPDNSPVPTEIEAITNPNDNAFLDDWDSNCGCGLLFQPKYSAKWSPKAIRSIKTIHCINDDVDCHQNQFMVNKTPRIIEVIR